MDEIKGFNQNPTGSEVIEAKKQFTSGTTFAGIGLVLLIVGNLFSAVPGNLSYLGNGFLIIAFAAIFIGCYRMAKGKGYHAAWSLLGFLSLIGFIILYFLPTRIKATEPIDEKTDSYNDQVDKSLKQLGLALLIIFLVFAAVGIWTWYVLNYKY